MITLSMCAYDFMLFYALNLDKPSIVSPEHLVINGEGIENTIKLI